MANAEKLSLSYFKRRYKGKFKPNNSLEWLSLLQHYGAPSRLVDFTYEKIVCELIDNNAKRK